MTEPLEPSRQTKSTHFWIIFSIAIVLIILWWTKIIKTGFAIGLGILLLAAVGIETLNYDLDLGKLWETGSITSSRVSHTKEGIKLLGECALPKNQKDTSDLDCKNFTTQAEAQTKYNQCATEIASYNTGIDTKKLVSLDIYRLDGDKDGIVCESLPWIPKEEIKNETVTQKAPPPKKKSSPSQAPAKTQPTTKTTGTFQTTPVLRTSNAYEMTEASNRSTPKALPAQ